MRETISDQVRHVARLLAAQMTAIKLGPGFEATKYQQTSLKTQEDMDDDDDYDDDDAKLTEMTKISTVIGGTPSMNLAAAGDSRKLSLKGSSGSGAGIQLRLLCRLITIQFGIKYMIEKELIMLLFLKESRLTQFFVLNISF
jgi:hypothetical protein